MRHAAIFIFAVSMGATVSPSLFAQPAGFNYDEDKVPDYTLPDPLIHIRGESVTTAEQWTSARRGEILELFQQHVYGTDPGPPSDVTFDIFESADDAISGKAVRKQVAITITEGDRRIRMDLLLYVPKAGEKPVPAFLGLNFRGNHSIEHDPEIVLNTNWMRNDPERGNVDHRATPASRGVADSRWPVEMIIDAGYAVATMYYGDIDPDFDDGFENGIHALYPRPESGSDAASAGGSIAAWAWGLSRALDYLETDPDINDRQVAVLGHSRLGKTSLWAGARDERFAMVISNDSGCGGAALSRRRFGETVARINTAFPHWFCSGFHRYNDREQALPVDQHELIALIAPRPVYIASATEDQWADPHGEFLAGVYADPVYKLLGTPGLPTKTMPPPDTPVQGQIGYHLRTGKHDLTEYDWRQYLKFADKHFRATDDR